MRYVVVIEKAEKNYSAFVPDLPGCVATGRTPAVVAKRIRAAIKMHHDGMREDGDPIPPATTRSISVVVNARDRRGKHAA